MAAVPRDLHYVGYEVIQLLDNPAAGSPQKLRELFLTVDLPAVLCEPNEPSNGRTHDFKSLDLYERPQLTFQHKIGGVLASVVRRAERNDGDWIVQKMGGFIDVDLMALDPKYCKLFGTRQERAIEVGFTLLVSRALRITAPEALDLLQLFKQKCQQSHTPGLHTYASAMSWSSIGAASQSNSLCDPFTSFLDRFGVLAADRATASRGAQILRLLQQVQAFHFHRQLSFLSVLKKLFLTAKEYMDAEAPEDRFDSKGPTEPERRTAALVYQAVRDQFVCPAGGRVRDNTPLQETHLWASWIAARRRLLPRGEEERAPARSPCKLFETLVKGRTHWSPGVVPPELLALLKECVSVHCGARLQCSACARVRACVRP
jgi:hypothetical protein